MPSELPIACSLDATALPERLAEIGDLGRDALTDVQLDATRARLRFAAGAGIRSRVEAVVAAESECCAFLQMGVGDEPDAVVLTMQSPADAELVLGELVAAFGDPRKPA
jgi:hypothetical protein